MSDNVNRPDHYCRGKFECIDVMTEVFGPEKVMAFCELNAFKYIWRTDAKNGIEDVKKADWYLKKLQALHEQQSPVMDYWLMNRCTAAVLREALNGSFFPKEQAFEYMDRPFKTDDSCDFGTAVLIGRDGKVRKVRDIAARIADIRPDFDIKGFVQDYLCDIKTRLFKEEK